MGRPYDKQRWRRLRKVKLTRDPLCEYCPPGKITAATEVDHRTPISAGGDPWSWENLASSCHECHSKKTYHVDQRGRDHVPVQGVDPATGRPIDPAHWWNVKKKSLRAER